MDDEYTRPTRTDGVSRRTSDRVDGMSDEARAELAQRMAGRPSVVPDAPARRPVTLPYGPIRPGTAELDEETAELVARVSADLHRTERRLYQLDRSSSRSRYQMVEGGSPSARYTRLASRARRLERQLRRLRSLA
jgi:HPt (histidine-containing phosphotransfer) domain-containing protein